MNVFLDYLPLVCVLLLAFVPRRSKWYAVWVVVLATNVWLQWRLIEGRRQSASRLAAVETTAATLKDYGELAKLNWIGLPGDGFEVLYSSPVSALLSGTYTRSNDQYSFSSGPEAERKFEAVCEKFPTFPFTHFLYALSLRAHGDARWRREAEQAREILKKTTTIAGHHPAHDQALVEVGKMLHND